MFEGRLIQARVFVDSLIRPLPMLLSVSSRFKRKARCGYSVTTDIEGTSRVEEVHRVKFTAKDVFGYLFLPRRLV